MFWYFYAAGGIVADIIVLILTVVAIKTCITVYHYTDVPPEYFVYWDQIWRTFFLALLIMCASFLLSWVAAAVLFLNYEDIVNQLQD